MKLPDVECGHDDGEEDDGGGDGAEHHEQGWRHRGEQHRLPLLGPGQRV